MPLNDRQIKNAKTWEQINTVALYPIMWAAKPAWRLACRQPFLDSTLPSQYTNLSLVYRPSGKVRVCGRVALIPFRAFLFLA